MSHVNKTGNEVFSQLIRQDLRFEPMNAALTGPLTMTDKFPPLLVLDANGATRVVTLPAAKKGLFFIIVNSAVTAVDLTVNAPPATLAMTVSQAELGFAVSDGISWFAGVVKTT